MRQIALKFGTPDRLAFELTTVFGIQNTRSRFYIFYTEFIDFFVEIEHKLTILMQKEFLIKITFLMNAHNNKSIFPYFVSSISLVYFLPEGTWWCLAVLF